MAEFRPQEILRVLAEHGVRFIVIGGLAGAFHDVGWVTEDIDIAVADDSENLERLAAALAELEARFAMVNPAQVILPTLGRIQSLTGPMLLTTKHGRLDVLRKAGSHTYESLIQDGLVGTFGEIDTQIVSLRKLVELKRTANRKKDREVLPMLEKALAELYIPPKVEGSTGQLHTSSKNSSVPMCWMNFRATSLSLPVASGHDQPPSPR